MWCLELRIPPIPQLIKIDRAVWEPGMRHFERTFDVYDLLYIRSGTFYMTEADEAFTVGPGEILTLQPGLKHWGHRAVEEATEIYWLHFVHAAAPKRVDSGSVAWSTPVAPGVDTDVAPPEQYLYVPKHAKVDPDRIEPLMEEMIALSRSLVLRDAIRLQAAAAGLFARLQETAGASLRSRAWRLSEQAVRYLRANLTRPFDSRDMEQSLHYQFDYVTRCMKQYTGMSPLQYWHHLQVEEAKTLLKHTDLAVQEVAERVGQPNANYFIRLFRRTVGMPPGAYRALNRESL